LCLARSALGQTPPAPQEPPPRVEASAQFALLDTSGNTSAQSLGAGGDWTWRPDPWQHAAKATFAQSEADDILNARSFAALYRTSRAMTQYLSIYGQYDFLHDVFAGVDQRHVIEGGVSYLAVEYAPHTLRVDVGLGYLNEQGPDRSLNSSTLSAGVAYKLAISQTSEFTYEPRFVLPIGETGAWKFGQDTSLVVAINSMFSLKLTHTVRYSAAPPAGFKTTDTILGVSFVAKVRRAA
jgi:putative salt-induced outer membrane protein YdiY